MGVEGGFRSHRKRHLVMRLESVAVENEHVGQGLKRREVNEHVGQGLRRSEVNETFVDFALPDSTKEALPLMLACPLWYAK